MEVGKGLKNGKWCIKMRDMDKDSHVIRLLKSAYEKSGKTYKDIDAETRIAQSFLSRILNGKQYASLSMLVKLGQAVNLKPKQVAEAWKKDKISEIDAEIAEIINNT